MLKTENSKKKEENEMPETEVFNMKKIPSISLQSSGRTNIRMSKRGRALQTSTAQLNWGEMVKMLFEVDPNGGRKAENGRLISLRRNLPEIDKQASYANDQIQYILFLTLIVSTAEKRIDELYRKSFAEKCDAISESHGLKDEEYWPEGKEPEEWQNLNDQFEKEAIQIHLATLREYHQNEIADMVEHHGLEQLFDIMSTIRSQFVAMIKSFQGNAEGQFGSEGTLPEMLNPLLSRRK